MVLNHRYQVEHVFNDKGGMGLIYRALDLNLRGNVILKKSRFVDEQSRSAFEREARLLYGLRHNALPRVIDYFLTDDGGQFFVMEFIPGKDLSEMLSERIESGEGPFPLDEVLLWGDQLLDSLHYLHMHKPPIIHRDIKPQNLKLMPDGQIILLDFGLAKGAVSGMTFGGASIQGYTPNYAPLEQMRGSGTDARSDLYSLAVTMHCLLTGQMPPDPVSRAIETLSAQPDPLRPVHEINPAIPLIVSDLLERASSLNQNERPANAKAMRVELQKARKEISLVASQVKVQEVPEAKVVEAPEANPPQAELEAKPTQAAPEAEASTTAESPPAVRAITVADYVSQPTNGFQPAPEPAEQRADAASNTVPREAAENRGEASPTHLKAEAPDRAPAQAPEPLTNEKPNPVSPPAPEPPRAKVPGLLPRLKAAQQQGENRPTSLIVIEHKGEGKNQPESPKAPPAEKAAPAATPSADEKPNRREAEAAPAKTRPAPPTPTINDKPREKAPPADFTSVPSHFTHAFATPAGMRSYAETLGFGQRLEMHVIPGGDFLMGSPERRGYADEYPQHRVTLSPFYIGKYPVTQAQWEAVMRFNPSNFVGPNLPVDCVTWDEAVEFCRRLSYATARVYRLPTEAEWEYACRAGTQTKFNYGDEEEFLVHHAWCLNNASNQTQPVGLKKPNGWGLYDMHGNVWEWCQDWYASDYYQHSPSVNPHGPAQGASRVQRGGSWYSLPNYCRSAGRSNHQPDQRDALVGFRVACEAKTT
jgi:formylglycine-generating enzyme required for sulfatase activity